MCARNKYSRLLCVNAILIKAFIKRAPGEIIERYRTVSSSIKSLGYKFSLVAVAAWADQGPACRPDARWSSQQKF